MKQKILIFHPYLATYRVDLYNQLSKDFDIKVLLTGSQSELDTLGFDLEKVNSKAEFDYKYFKDALYWGRHPISTIFWKTIKRYRPDVIIAHEYGINTFAAIIAKLTSSNIKVWVTCDDNVQMAQNYSTTRKALRNIIVRNVDGVITVSQSTLDFLKQNYPKHCSKFTLFPIIQNDAVLRRNILKSASIAESYVEKNNLGDKHIFLFVGRLESVKNIELLIKAYSNVYKDNTCLIIVGSGSLEKKLNYLADSLQLNNHIIFTGNLSGEYLYAWYYLAHTFTLPSKHEPFGAVVNEALISGCKCIVSDVCGSSTLINQENGEIFESGNQAELEKCLANEISHNTTKKHESLMPKPFSKYYEDLIRNFTM